MKTFQMYNGDLPIDPAQPSVWQGDGGSTSVTTAKECALIYQKCLNEKRFPGEHVKFHSGTNDHGVLLEVILECNSMDSFTLHMVDDGWIMVTEDGDGIVGFVHRMHVAGGTVQVPAFGVAYIGG